MYKTNITNLLTQENWNHDVSVHEEHEHTETELEVDDGRAAVVADHEEQPAQQQRRHHVVRRRDPESQLRRHGQCEKYGRVVAEG